MPLIEYARPSQHGVTSLMAVGDDVAAPPSEIRLDVERATKYAFIGGVVGALRGGRRTASYALAGAGLSLLANIFGR